MEQEKTVSIFLKIAGLELPPIEASPDMEAKLRETKKTIENFVIQIKNQDGFTGASLLERLAMYAVHSSVKVLELEEENQELRKYLSQRLKNLESIIRDASN
ncbi:MAG: hypothetical protein U0Y10_20060 [Spirosomataceae bacterium]